MFRLLIALLVLLVPSVAQAEKRLALLIGNESYSAEIGRLSNPHNDVGLIEKVLKGLGFDVVSVRDAGLATLHQAVNGYARRVQAAGPNAVGFFYYSGHGAADGGVNYLIPIDVKTAETGDLWDQSLQLTEITRKLKRDAGNATHYVVFDACRNTLRLKDPTSKAMSQAKGFVPVSQESGMLIAYATAEGELASDVGAGAGPYATALAEEIVRPSVESVAMFRTVQRRVRTAIRQEPYLGFNALGDIYLAGNEAPKQPSPVAAAPAQTQRLSDAAEAWDRTKDSTSIPVLELFMNSYKDTYYAGLARLRTEELKRQQEAAQQAANAAKQKAEGEAARIAKAEAERQRLAMLHEAEAAKKREAAADATNPGRVFRDCPDCPEMVVVPAGSFMMGSEYGDADEKPVHKVTIARPFAVGKFDVTFAEWDACVAASGCKHKPEDQGWGRSTRPVINVSWDDASKEYLPWLGRKTGKTYRLLTEVEWEYAVRAGTTTTYSWGSDIGKGNANCSPCGSQWDGKQTAPVGSFKPNAFGLYDMHGNVWQWVQDCYKDSYANASSDGKAASEVAGCSRVVRGGSWGSGPRYLRAALRYRFSSVYRAIFNGFRVARALNP